MRRINHQVGVGRVVDGGDLAVPDAQVLLNDLHHRCQAVGGAGRCGDDAVCRRVVALVVHANHDIENVAHLDRRSHDHAFGTAVKVALQGLGCEEFAGAFQHQFHPHVAPGNVGSLAMGGE